MYFGPALTVSGGVVARTLMADGLAGFHMTLSAGARLTLVKIGSTSCLMATGNAPFGINVPSIGSGCAAIAIGEGVVRRRCWKSTLPQIQFAC